MEDKIINSLDIEIKYPCGQHSTHGCGLDFNPPKYKEDCYFYEEAKDMGATIRYRYCCAQSEIEWGYCPCEKCDKYISNTEASKIIRNYVEKRTEKNVCQGLGSDYCMSECEISCPYR